jgi:uncharacterized membrane protein
MSWFVIGLIVFAVFLIAAINRVAVAVSALSRPAPPPALDHRQRDRDSFTWIGGLHP